MTRLEEITNQIVAFRDARDWKQFHNPKDLALSLVLESTELLEHFQWKNGPELERYTESNKVEISEELADVLYWVLLIGVDLDIDLLNSLEKKLAKNNEKYPVDKSRGSYKKYTELGS